MAASLPKHGPLPDTHTVPDVLRQNLDVVFCGTALGHKSAVERAYYAHPGNLFWRTLFETGLTPELIKPHTYTDVLKHGIGLTDLCKHAYGSDALLPADGLDSNARAALMAKILEFQPRFLAFTSKTAAACFLQKPTGKLAYGLQDALCGLTQIYVLTSPSGLSRSYWNVGVWKELADNCDTPARAKS